MARAIVPLCRPLLERRHAAAPVFRSVVSSPKAMAIEAVLTLSNAMATTNNSARTGRGAAEEPEPEPGDSVSSSSTTTSYDPTVFQRPHPDDRGAGGKTRCGKGSAKPDALEDKDKDDDKDKKGKSKGAPSLDFCGNCGAEGELRKCKQCGAVAYCGEACQRVSAMARGWEQRRTRASAPQC